MASAAADAASSRPIHEQISTALAEQITSGQLAVGSRLPGEAELMAQFGVARGTVRRALRTLNDQGLVHTVQGKGTYVRAQRAEPSIAQTFVGLAESLSYSDRQLSTQVLTQRVVPAAECPQFPAALDPSESLLFLDRVRFLDVTPVARLRNWVRLGLAPGVEEVDYTVTALFTALDTHARSRVTSGRRVLDAVIADDDVAMSLHLPPVAPVLHLLQETYLADGQVVECSQVWMDSRHISVAVNLSR